MYLVQYQEKYNKQDINAYDICFIIIIILLITMIHISTVFQYFQFIISLSQLEKCQLLTKFAKKLSPPSRYLWSEREGEGQHNPCMSSLPVPACLPGLFYNLIKTTPQSTVHTSLLYPFNLQTVNKSLS